jgi:ubiquinol-cytochrome c reductase cytochrome b subunit
MVIPTAFLAAFMSAPFLDRFGSNRWSTACRLIVVAACFAGWGWLTWLSYKQDWNDAEYLAEQIRFESLSSRARDLARTEPISEKGAIQLLRLDPQTQGPRLFAQHCISCHSHADAQDQGLKAKEPSGPNLYRVGTADWIAGFLEPQEIVSSDYFGGTAFRDGDMVQHVQGLFANSAADGETQKNEMIAAMSVALAAEAEFESTDAPLAVKGREIMKTSGGCTDCHHFHDQGELGSAPDLTGYASANWLKQMIAKPTGERFYRDHNDRMPEFAVDANHPELNLISSQELDLLIRWLRTPAQSTTADK